MDQIEAKGYLGGSVSFDGQFVTISRKGLNRFTIGKGQKRIHVSKISAVQLKPAGPMVNGFIEFSMSGGDERRSRFGRQTMDATSDENSVVFTKSQQAQFERLRSAVEDAMARGFSPAPAPPQADIAGQLQRLSELHQSGALSDAEFSAAKSRLIG
ncbi:DUF4429 domain-containing protein [Actinokineospora sp.]|uniref:DUF4429 domain-containing protein n=1 Tax=Actinokineospora sp. TaxID=1872133 RepID=UPI003D6BE44E